jgi:hypothetical protein
MKKENILKIIELLFDSEYTLEDIDNATKEINMWREKYCREKGFNARGTHIFLATPCSQIVNNDLEQYTEIVRGL